MEALPMKFLVTFYISNTFPRLFLCCSQPNHFLEVLKETDTNIDGDLLAL